MRTTTRSLFPLLIGVLALGGCSTRAAYEMVAGSTEADCNRYQNLEERSRCKKEAQLSYDQYQKERQKATGASPSR